MERDESTANSHLVKLFSNYDPDGVSEYSSNPTNPETGNRLSKRLVVWIKDNLTAYSTERFLVNLCWPNIETVESRMMIKMWLNQDDREKGLSARRVMKPGKAMRHLFPWLSDSDIERYVDAMRLELGERVYTLKTAQDAETFKAVYIGKQCRMENPRTTDGRKSLANSCMRYGNIMHRDCDGNMRHPAEAYASGEFTIAYVTDNEGHIAARCVVWTEPNRPVPAPIYGVCEKSMDMVQDYLESINAEFCDDWQGARLDAIEHDSNQWIAPYLDLTPRELDYDGDSLVVTRYGDIDASNYSGILGESESMCTCENCGARYDSENEGCFVDEGGVCDSCYGDSNYCEYYDERTFQDVEIVYLWHRHGQREEQYWCGNAIENHATRVGEDYWQTDVLYQDYEGGYITPEQVDNGEYFTSDWSDEFYPSAEMCETEDGETVSKQELDDDKGVWEQGANGVWYQVQIATQEKVTS